MWKDGCPATSTAVMTLTAANEARTEGATKRSEARTRDGIRWTRTNKGMARKGYVARPIRTASGKKSIAIRSRKPVVVGGFLLIALAPDQDHRDNRARKTAGENAGGWAPEH